MFDVNFSILNTAGMNENNIYNKSKEIMIKAMYKYFSLDKTRKVIKKGRLKDRVFLNCLYESHLKYRQDETNEEYELNFDSNHGIMNSNHINQIKASDCLPNYKYNVIEFNQFYDHHRDLVHFEEIRMMSKTLNLTKSKDCITKRTTQFIHGKHYKDRLLSPITVSSLMIIQLHKMLNQKLSKKHNSKSTIKETIFKSAQYFNQALKLLAQQRIIYPDENKKINLEATTLYARYVFIQKILNNETYQLYFLTSDTIPNVGNMLEIPPQAIIIDYQNQNPPIPQSTIIENLSYFDIYVKSIQEFITQYVADTMYSVLKYL